MKNMKPYDYLKKTAQFEEWIRTLNPVTQAVVIARTERARNAGYFGDHHGIQGKSKGGNRISEMRIDSGPGWRLYYTAWEYRGQVLLMLVGGDKSTQRRNIKLALAIVDEAKAKAEREIDEELSKREEAQKHGQHRKKH